MPLANGTLLGRYEIESPLGAGGMGEMYRARDTRLERTVAIKILPSHLSNNPTRQRFEREAKAISSLQHPNICTLYDESQTRCGQFASRQLVPSAISSRRLYFASRSDWRMDPFLNWSVCHPTARSAAQLSSVSPLRTLRVTDQPADRACLCAARASVRVPI